MHAKRNITKYLIKVKAMKNSLFTKWSNPIIKNHPNEISPEGEPNPDGDKNPPDNGGGDLDPDLQ